MDQKLLDILLNKSKEIMEQDKMFHDFAHAKNVLNYAIYLEETLGGDKDIIYTAALFHDIARDVDNHPIEGAKQLQAILNKIDTFPKDKIAAVCAAVEHHEEGQTTHDEKVIADADKMDAFNELASGRGFMMSAKKGYTLKSSIKSYLRLLETWFNQFHFDESREYVVADYANSKRLLQKMLSMYEDSN